MAIDTRDRNAIVLAALRISVGTLFLIFGEYKVFATLSLAKISSAPKMARYVVASV